MYAFTCVCACTCKRSRVCACTCTCVCVHVHVCVRLSFVASRTSRTPQPRCVPWVTLCHPPRFQKLNLPAGHVRHKLVLQGLESRIFACLMAATAFSRLQHSTDKKLFDGKRVFHRNGCLDLASMKHAENQQNFTVPSLAHKQCTRTRSNTNFTQTGPPQSRIQAMRRCAKIFVRV